jgi:hypothetical protein
MSEEWPQKMHRSRERERCKKDNEKPDSAQTSRDSMTFHRVIDELTDRLMP